MSGQTKRSTTKKATTARSVGRPSDYDPAYCQKIIEIGKTGASVVEMACELGVCRATLEANWPAAHPAFLEAFTRAKLESQAWWERKGRESLTTAGFQGSVWSRSMAARFPADWRERSETDLNVKGDIAGLVAAGRKRVAGLGDGDPA